MRVPSGSCSEKSPKVFDYPSPQTFTEFYDLMSLSRTVRLRIVNCAMAGPVAPKESERLRGIRDALLGMPREQDGRYRLASEDGSLELPLRIDYELNELKRDIYFVERGTDALDELIAAGGGSSVESPPLGTSQFWEEVEAATDFIQASAPSTVVSDRDGTVNHYCDRYRSSVQSAYNALYLARFRAQLPGPVALLSAAPLTDGGLLQLATMPIRSALYAGSKGREYIDGKGRRQREELPASTEEKLEQLNERLEAMLQEPRYAIFRLVGSGLQKKVGETVVAHQTASLAVPEELSREIVSRVERIVGKIDPKGEVFTLHDTGKDMEIISAPDREGSAGYTKGDGVRFLNRAAPLGLGQHGALVCGDTESDLPMFQTVRELSAEARAVLVSTNDGLIAEAQRLDMPLCVVSSPDVLVLAFHTAAKRRN